MDRLVYSVFVCAFLPGIVDALVCYNCTGVSRVADCTATVACNQDESCFQERIARPQGHLFNMGCRRTQDCHTTPQSIIGRRYLLGGITHPYNCTDCCDVETCNRGLCWNDGGCLDSHDVDCSTVNSLFDVCKDVSHAKATCKQFCGLCDVVDGRFSSWSGWSSCSVTCGNGTESRSRSCTNPAPANGGTDCDGLRTGTQLCQQPKCPVHGGWSKWSPWGTCSVSCGPGMQRRDRSCSNPYPDQHGDHCYGDSRDDRICTPKACADGGWATWNTWTTCSATCGNGFKTRSRDCKNPEPSPYGKPCSGQPNEITSCSINRCLDGGWATWNTWTTCSATCGNGFKTRTRNCTNPKPSPYGEPCSGQPMGIITCNVNKCPDGGWATWNTWTTCSATCGNGFKTRSRDCTNPKPSPYGKSCSGQPMGISSCSNKRCPDVTSAFSVDYPKTILQNHLTFSNTIYNLGGDFNPSTGVFTCSKPGVYVFTFVLVKKRSSARLDSVGCSLYKNDRVFIITGHVNPTDDDTDIGSAYAGNKAVVHLDRGNTVALRYCSDPSTHMELWTSFSGFLLYPDV